MGVDGSIVQVDGERVIYRASALGSCTRALVAARQGIEANSPPAQLQKVFDRGNRLEVAVADKLARLGYLLFERDGPVTLHLSGKLSVVGHVDAIGEFRRESPLDVTGREIDEWRGVVEIKSQNEEEWAKDSIRNSKFWDKYEWQISVYMLATGLPCLVVRALWDKNDNDGELTAWPKMKYEEFTSPPKSRLDILRRVMEAEHLAVTDARELSCDEGYGCPYWSALHKKKEVEFVSVDNQALEDACFVYRLRSDDMARAKADVERARKVIVSELGDMDGVRAGGFVVTKSVSTIEPGMRKGYTRTQITVRRDGEDG